MPLPARPGSPRRNGTGGPSTRMAEDQLTPFLAECRGRVEGVLRSCLAPADTEPKRLHEAMRYAVLGDGKRLRPTLAYAAASATGVPWERLDAPAAALELIHAYSLVHDDMPALDDDDLRRGHPTCHVAFDQATALLAGDALQALAFDVLAQDRHSNAAARIAMVGELARASGSLGMAGGQALDLASEGQELDIAALENVHIHKTGALIRASVRMSAFANESLCHRRRPGERRQPPIAIDKVGIKDIRHPVKIKDRSGHEQHTVATFNMYVFLPHNFKGTHMSRFVAILNGHEDEIGVGTFKQMLSEMAERLESEAGHIEMRFPFFVKKQAPVTGVPSLMDYDVTLIGEIRDGKPHCPSRSWCRSPASAPAPRRSPTTAPTTSAPTSP
jgi:hypothetical protein